MTGGRRGAALVSATAALVLSGCGSTPTGSAAVVQIAKFTIAPGTVTCGGPGAAASPDTVLLQVELVNTTSEDATVVSAGSYGTVIRSATGAFVGTTANVFDALPYTPQSALVVARSGDVTIRISLPTRSMCATVAGNFKDIQTTARISTNSGQYTTVGAIIHVFFQ